MSRHLDRKNFRTCANVGYEQPVLALSGRLTLARVLDNSSTLMSPEASARVSIGTACGTADRLPPQIPLSRASMPRFDSRNAPTSTLVARLSKFSGRAGIGAKLAGSAETPPARSERRRNRRFSVGQPRPAPPKSHFMGIGRDISR